MKRTILKQLLALLGASMPWSCASSAAFVAPPRSSKPAAVAADVSRWRTAPSFSIRVNKDDSIIMEAPDQPKRGVKKLFSRRGRSKRARVRMQTMDTVEDTTSGTVPFAEHQPPFLWNNGTDDWIVKDIESLTPTSTGLTEITGKREPVGGSMARLTPPSPPKQQEASSTTTTAFANARSIHMGSNSTMSLALEPPITTTSTPTSSIPQDSGGSLLNRWSRNWFQSILLGLLHKWSVEDPINLQVHASPRGNVLGNLFFKLQYRSNIQLVFDKVTFGNIRISGGGQVNAERLAFNLKSVFTNSKRFPAQFEFHASNCTLTQDDLLQSSCIRNGLGRLLVRILRNAGVDKTADVTITSVDILPSNKISCLGTAKTHFGSRVVFEVRSGIGTSCRGHVLTFPGLEVTLQPALGVFLPVVPDINLDVGHNARLKRVQINGKQKIVTLDASVSITPGQEKTKKYIQSHKAYLAQFCFDVGQWITDIGNFTK